MNNTIPILKLGLVLLLPLTCLMLLIGAMFKQLTSKARSAIETAPGRIVLIGLVNLIFLAAIIALSAFLVDRVGLPPVFGILGIAAAVIFPMGVSIGITSISQLIGERAMPEYSQPKRNTLGAIILVLALLTPLVGWFIFLPYLAMLGFGGAVYASYQTWRESSKKPAANQAK